MQRTNLTPRVLPHLQILVMLSFMSVHVSGQVTVAGDFITPEYITPAIMTRLIVVNAGQPGVYSLEARLRNTRSGEVLLSIQSGKINLKTGSTMLKLNSGDLVVSYGSSDESNYLQNFKKLQEGSYEYCAQFTGLSGEATNQQYCKQFNVTSNENLLLVSPENGSDLKNVHPVLSWMTNNQAYYTTRPSEDNYYKLVLVKESDKEGAEQAISSEPVLFNKQPLTSFSVPYPLDAPALEKGKTYAWQVQHIVSNHISEKSEAWKFTIHKDTTEQPLKYVELKKDFDGTYYLAHEGKIYFAIDEPYAANYNFPKYKLSDSHGNNYMQNPHYEATSEEDAGNQQNDSSQAATAEMKRTGYNRYELNLKPLNLDPGIYNLIVWNSKGEQFKLKIKMQE